MVDQIRTYNGRGHDAIGHAAVDLRIFHPVAVTVCGVFQLAEVKVRLASETVPSLVSLDDRPIVTLAVVVC